MGLRVSKRKPSQGKGGSRVTKRKDRTGSFKHSHKTPTINPSQQKSAKEVGGLNTAGGRINYLGPLPAYPDVQSGHANTTPLCGSASSSASVFQSKASRKQGSTLSQITKQEASPSLLDQGDCLNCVILDWDDTLCPTWWMKEALGVPPELVVQNLNLRAMCARDLKHALQTGASDLVKYYSQWVGLQSPPTVTDLLPEEEGTALLTLPPEKRNQVRALQKSVLAALRSTLKAVGGDSRNVVIITNAQLEWQEYTARLLLPRVWAFIQQHNIQVVSAREAYLQTIGDKKYLKVTEKIRFSNDTPEATRWKHVAFAKWLYDREIEFSKERQERAQQHQEDEETPSTTVSASAEPDRHREGGTWPLVPPATASCFRLPPTVMRQGLSGSAAAACSASAPLSNISHTAEASSSSTVTMTMGSPSKVLGRPCLNVLSVGDAPGDVEALRGVARDRHSWFSCGYVKTLKFKQRPSIEELTYQLKHMPSSVRSIMTEELPQSKKVSNDLFRAVQQRREEVRSLSWKTYVWPLKLWGSQKPPSPLSRVTEQTPVLFYTPTQPRVEPVSTDERAEDEKPEEEEDEESEREEDEEEDEEEDSHEHRFDTDVQHGTYTQGYGHVGHEAWNGGMAEQGSFGPPLPQWTSPAASLHTSIDPSYLDSTVDPSYLDLSGHHDGLPGYGPWRDRTDTRRQFAHPYHRPPRDSTPPSTSSFISASCSLYPVSCYSHAGAGMCSSASYAGGIAAIGPGASPGGLHSEEAGLSNHSSAGVLNYTMRHSQIPHETGGLVEGQWTAGGHDVQNGNGEVGVEDEDEEGGQTSFQGDTNESDDEDEILFERDGEDEEEMINTMLRRPIQQQRVSALSQQSGGFERAHKKTNKGTGHKKKLNKSARTCNSTEICPPLPPWYPDVVFGPSQSLGETRERVPSLCAPEGGPGVGASFSSVSSSSSASASASSSSSASAGSGAWGFAQMGDEDEHLPGDGGFHGHDF